MKKIFRIIGVIIIALYFFISIFTLNQYGINWDEVEHLMRGQAYLNFFLTGREHYDPQLFEEGNRYSFYQMPQYDFAKWKKIDAGHPVLSDIASSFFNFIFYQKLGIVNDFDAYHLYGPVLVTFFLVFLFFWVEKYYGGFAAFISLLSLVLYPLFYGESHFNVQKDIPEAVFYSSAIMTFFIGYTTKSAKWILFSALLFGFAWGTKFNILFMPIILLLWLIVKEKKAFFKKLLALSKNVKVALLLYPFIGFGIFFFSWPYLWFDPVNNISQILGYYKTIGTVPLQNISSFYVFGFNTYALQWIMYTTPLVILFLSFIGISYVLKKGFKEKDKISFLILIWFLFPILRVTIPNTSIYGGVRQIMEYIPPMAILSGIGAHYIVHLFHGSIVKHSKKFTNKIMNQLTNKRLMYILQSICILTFIPITLRMISLFPNESIYFNPLIGGLQGAREKNIPGWGNSLGSTYKQGKYWLNIHAEKNAKVALRFENVSNIPRTMLRADIKYSNTRRSGPKRLGEYVIGVDHYGTHKELYHYNYLERFLIPVYVVKVDNVPILKIWKNDLAHTKPEFRKSENEIKNIAIKKIENTGRLFIEFSHKVRLTKLMIEYSEEKCIIPSDGRIHTSVEGKSWTTLPGTFLEFSGFAWFQPNMEKGKLQYLFAADTARFVLFTGNTEKSCLFKNPIHVRAWEI